MFIRLATVLISVGFTVFSPAAEAVLSPFLSGTVVAVQDGDTFTMQNGTSIYEVRLSDVDAPELRQVFGRQARQFTEQRVLGRRVWVKVSFVDTQHRHIGEVIREDGGILNEELVHAGLAWYYRVDPTRNKRLQQLEQYAFSKKLGLWVEREPVPPWEFRRESRIPEIPVTAEQVDYDRIFHYGLIGNRRSKTLRWPACKNYRLKQPQKALIFHSLEQARQQGFQPARDCPR